MEYRILNTIGEVFDQTAKEVLSSIGEVDYRIPSQEELVGEISKYDIVICGLGLHFSSDVLDNAPNLKVIATATTGLDHVDLKRAEEKKIKILSLKDENEFLDTITGTAELSLALMLSLARNIPSAVDSVKNNEWDREKFKGHSVCGYTLGIVGLGRLGKMMARYGSALGMRVIFCDPNVSQIEKDWQKVTFERLVKESDFISIKVHLSNETEYMFNKDVFKLMKSTSYLINTSRGKIVNEEDLINALEDKKLAGYATDVLDGEINFINGKIVDHPLVSYAKTHPNVIVTPHIGGMTYESRRDTDIFIANKISSYVGNMA